VQDTGAPVTVDASDEGNPSADALPETAADPLPDVDVAAGPTPVPGPVQALSSTAPMETDVAARARRPGAPRAIPRRYRRAEASGRRQP
jgi:hypothetical protein